MQTIKLTSIVDGSTLRLNPEHIVAYWNSDTHKGSEVKVSIGPIDQGIIVKESPDEIDELLEAV